MGYIFSNTTTPTFPQDGFGAVATSEPEPRAQIAASSGLRELDVEQFKGSDVGLSGTTEVNENVMFKVTTGTSANGYGVIRSQRITRSRPGQGLSFVFTARFDAGVANSLLVAGAFTATDALWFGYNGASFGVLRRIPGALEIQRLTLSAGASGNESIDITLDGTSYAGISVTSGSAAKNAAEIVAGFTGTLAWNAQSVGDTVIFQRRSPVANSSTYSFTNTTGGGTCAGSFAQVLAGAANDNDTGFTAQSAWNVDRMDGSAGPFNATATTLDPTKLNYYRILFPGKGGASITYQVMHPDKPQWITVHVEKLGSNQTVPVQKWPFYRVGWTAASLGSTTDLAVYGTEASGYVEGPVRSVRNPFATDNDVAAVGTTETHILSIRSALEFGDFVNQAEVLIQRIGASIDQTNNRQATLRIYSDATLTGDVLWTEVDASSSVHVAKSGVTGFSGGKLVYSGGFGRGDGKQEDIRSLDLRLEPSKSLTFTAQLASSTADVGVSTIYLED